MELQEKILDTIKTYKLIDPKDIVIVAVSGGPDSMCLLDNLLSIKEKLEIKEIVVAHVNHQIREEAQSETEYVEEYCKHKKIRCFTKYVNIPQIALEQRIGTEEAGRNERYKFFDEVAQKINADKIAIAHNLNDNAETVLMHLMRGSGISGLCGIKASVEGRIIRPLIKCERTEIEQYCKEKNLDPKFDKSNNDNTYTRNKIRNELIPYIQNNINPNIIQTLSRLSELVIEEEKFMEKTILKNYTNIMINEDLLKGEIILDLRKFNELERVIKSRIILLAVQKIFGNTKHIEKKHIEDIIKLCCNNIGNKYLMPNKSTKIMVKQGKIHIKSTLNEKNGY